MAIGEITGTTGSAGGCTLSNVPYGNVTVTAVKEGYESYSQSLTVDDSTTSLQITLTETT